MTFMGNFASSKVESQGKVTLKMTFHKETVLDDVLHVLDIRINLVFGALLSKNDFKVIFVLISLYSLKMSYTWERASLC